MVAPHHVGKRAFLPLADPADGAAQRAGGVADGRVFGVVENLCAEPAAGIDMIAADLLQRQAQRLRQLFAHAPRALTTIGERQFRAVPVGEDAARLHRMGDDLVIDDIDRDGVRRLGKRLRRRVFVAKAPVEGQISRDVIMKLRRPRRQRHVRVADDRQFLIVHNDSFGRVLRLSFRLRHDQGDGLADIADAIFSQIGPPSRLPLRTITVVDQYGGHDIADLARDFSPRPDSQNARHGPRIVCIHRNDPRMSDRRAQKDSVRHAVLREILQILTGAGQKPGVFLTGHWLTDAELAHLRIPSRCLAGR